MREGGRKEGGRTISKLLPSTGQHSIETLLEFCIQHGDYAEISNFRLA